jgi:hypothetical protein
MFVRKVLTLVIKASHLLHENHTVVSGNPFFLIFMCTSDEKYLAGIVKSDSEILQRAF